MKFTALSVPRRMTWSLWLVTVTCPTDSPAPGVPVTPRRTISIRSQSWISAKSLSAALYTWNSSTRFFTPFSVYSTSAVYSVGRICQWGLAPAVAYWPTVRQFARLSLKSPSRSKS
jgi:hypothetical protein